MDNIVLTLLSTPKVGKKTARYFIENIVDTPKNEIEILEIFNELKNYNKRIIIPSIEDIKLGIERKNEIIRLSNKQDIKMIDILDNKFPLKLKYIDDAPIILFYKGNYNSVINDKSIAVVGSRKAGKECLELSYNIAKYFAREGYTIVSGLANGCDEYAHKGCLETKGNTVAVLGSGLDNIYPKRNIKLAENIVNNNGCLISEYPIGTKSFKQNFIERDRIQSGLSSAILVVEANLDSGTMHTVNFAKKQGRLIACCNINASGNRKLIEESNCILMDNINQIRKLIIQMEKVNEDLKCIKNIRKNYTQEKFKI